MWSQLEYASKIWSPWLYKDKLELEKVQQWAARFVCNNYDPMYNCYDRPTELAEIKKIVGITLVYVCFSRWCNTKFMFLLMTFHHQHLATNITRSSHERNLLVPYARTDVYKYSFFPHTASLWNKLHKTIKETQSLDIFKSRI